MKGITKICVYDFDGTLVSSPLPEQGKLAYKEKTGIDWPHEGWWSKPSSLDMTIFDIPVINSVIESYTLEQDNEGTLMVMMTGRLTKLSKEVEIVLTNHGLVFDKHIYNMGGSTIESKIKSLNKLLVEYPNVIDVLLTDDRVEHVPIFQKWGDSQIEQNRLTKFHINVVPTGRH
jgi:hypothetical protein